jgi:hypothetical protein
MPPLIFSDIFDIALPAAYFRDIRHFSSLIRHIQPFSPPFLLLRCRR